MIFISISNIIKAQQNSIVYKKYSVIIPDGYQNTGKSYPLIVCYQNQTTDSLFQQYATRAQTIILQFDNKPDTTFTPDSLKSIIIKTIYEFSVASDKIYLLGVDQTIINTAKTKEALDYYFAATAYITSDPHTYTILNESLKLNNSVKLYYFNKIDYNVMNTLHELFLKNYSWSHQVNKIFEDVISLNIFNDTKIKNWRLSLSYGQWYFDNSTKSREITLLEFPKNMSSWNLSFAKFLSKHWSVKANLGLLIKKVVPPRPDFISLINGSNIDVEGGGIFLMPISIGIDFFFLKQRFRPYLGFSVGNVRGVYKYVEASGNLSNGINRNESKFISNAPFIELSTGFIYRTGKNIHFGLHYDYRKSKDFNKNIGGKNAYKGYNISLSTIIMF